MSKPATILIVDDDPAILELYEEALKGAGFGVLRANCAEDGIETARREKPSLILLDVNICCKADGVATLVKLKEYPETKDIKVVLLSAFGDPQAIGWATDKKIAKELEAVDFIRKGTEMAEIINQIRGFLNNSKH